MAVAVAVPLETSTQLHDHTWDEVMEKMYKANMRNFVVYLHEPTMQMFHHWEYIGSDFQKDMASLDNDPMIKHWYVLVRVRVRVLVCLPP